MSNKKNHNIKKKVAKNRTHRKTRSILKSNNSTTNKLILRKEIVRKSNNGSDNKKPKKNDKTNKDTERPPPPIKEKRPRRDLLKHPDVDQRVLNKEEGEGSSCYPLRDSDSSSGADEDIVRQQRVETRKHIRESNGAASNRNRKNSKQGSKHTSIINEEKNKGGKKVNK